MQEHILIVDDDNDILELLEYNLANAGYDVLGFTSTKHVRKVLSEEKIDLIIMDRNLPDIEGSLYIEMLRSKNLTTPVIFLSAKSSKEDIKNGFLRGADDYITKPFDLEELLLRIRAVLARYKSDSKAQQDVLEHKDLRLYTDMNKVTIGTSEVSITKLESHLLQVLLYNKGRVLDREFLLKQIWKNADTTHEKTVNVAMKRLKEKIDPLKEKEYIKTIRGVGYIVP